MAPAPLRYTSDPAWADVVPIAQIGGGPHALAEIAYTAEYSEAMSYLRAIMAKAEASERALDLTAHLIKLNPGHYTVWSYRAHLIHTLAKNLSDELSWLNTLAFEHPKNYQIWGYRQVIMESLSDPTNEQDLIAQMLVRDAKNYHVWTYRQWMVRHFNVWPAIPSSSSSSSTTTASPYPLVDIANRELSDVESLIDADMRNNSAWNHRRFILFERPVNEEGTNLSDPYQDKALINREIQYAASKIRLIHQNEAAWNYLRALVLPYHKLDKDGPELAVWIKLVVELSIPDSDAADSIIKTITTAAATSTAVTGAAFTPAVLATSQSSYGIDILAELLVLHGSVLPAINCLEALSQFLDPLRRPFWQLRTRLIWNTVNDGGQLEREWKQSKDTGTGTIIAGKNPSSSGGTGTLISA